MMILDLEEVIMVVEEEVMIRCILMRKTHTNLTSIQTEGGIEMKTGTEDGPMATERQEEGIMEEKEVDQEAEETEVVDHGGVV